MTAVFVSRAEIRAVFLEWEARRRANPEAFFTYPEVEELPPETLAEQSADCFLNILSDIRPGA